MLTIDALKEYGADTDDALARCMGNQDFYFKLIGKALEDKNEVRNFKLVGFKRITLDAGESADVVISITPDALKVVTDDGERVTPTGKIAIYAGFGQPDNRTAELYGADAFEMTI